MLSTQNKIISAIFGVILDIVAVILLYKAYTGTGLSFGTGVMVFILMLVAGFLTSDFGRLSDGLFLVMAFLVALASIVITIHFNTPSTLIMLLIIVVIWKVTSAD